MYKFIGGLGIGGVLGLIVGFMLGVYFLPILIEEEGASDTIAEQAVSEADRIGVFRRTLKDSDSAHWGEGQIALSTENGRKFLTLQGNLSPGPDYRLYLTPAFVETEQAFIAIKAQSVQVASIKAFHNFRVELPSHINADAYPAVLIWCERFSQFITAATLE